MDNSKKQRKKVKKPPGNPVSTPKITIKIRKEIWFAVSFILFFLASMRFQIRATGLDNSWIHALNNATLKGFNFADRFIFTYGPAWFLIHTNFYDPKLYYYFIIGIIFTSTVFGIYIMNSKRKILILLLLLWVYIIEPGEDIWPLFLILLIYRMEEAPKPSIQNMITLFWIGFMSFTKFSFFLMIFPLFIVLDGINILSQKYRYPLFTAAFTVSVVCAFIILGQNILTLFSFFANSYQISSGYSMAMGGSLENAGMTNSYITIGMLFLFAIATIVEVFRKNDSLKFKELLQSALKSVAILWVLFIIFKAGYVRGGDHTVNNTQSIFVFILMYILLIHTRAIKLYNIICFICLITILYIELPKYNLFDLKIFDDNLKALNYNKKEMDNKFYEMQQSVHKIPIPSTASVDSYNWDLAELILGGYNYDPRPVPQAYSTYTPKLQNLCRGHFTDYVIFNVNDIDERFPTLVLGESLTDMFLNYDVNNYCIIGYGPHVILKRRKTPRIKAIVDTFSTEFSAGKLFSLPHQSADFREARIDFKPTFQGEIKNFLLHQDISWIEVTTDTGAAYKFRFIPDVSNNGFLLSPLLLSTGDYVLSKNAGKIASIRIYSERSSMFNPKIRIKITDFNITGEPENAMSCNYNNLLAALGFKIIEKK